MTPEELRRSIDGFTDRDLLIEIYTRVENMHDQIDHLDKQIHGNGQPGLNHRVSKLEERTTPNTKVLSVTGGLAAAASVLITKLIEKWT